MVEEYSLHDKGHAENDLCRAEGFRRETECAVAGGKST
jgi:hypothetical protein